MFICLERGADLQMSQLMPLPLTLSCFSRIQVGFTFLVPAYPGSPGKGPLKVCVFACACVCVLVGETHEALLGEMAELRLVAGRESVEKDAALKSCSDLRRDVNRLEADSTQLSHLIQELKHTISGMLHCTTSWKI